VGGTYVPPAGNHVVRCVWNVWGVRPASSTTAIASLSSP